MKSKKEALHVRKGGLRGIRTKKGAELVRLKGRWGNEQLVKGKKIENFYAQWQSLLSGGKRSKRNGKVVHTQKCQKKERPERNWPVLQMSKTKPQKTTW